MSTPIDYADKIDKLLRKAASTDAEAEAEALFEKAYDLMAKRDIDMADIEARRRTAGQRIDEPIVEKTIKLTGIFRYGLKALAFAVIDALENVGVRAFYRDKTYALVGETRNGDPRFVDAVDFVIVGRQSDVNQTITLITSLEMQAAAAMTMWWKTSPDRDWMPRGLAFRSRRQFIISFGLGAAQKIRLAQRRAKSTLHSSGAELVLRDKNAEVDAYLDAKDLQTKASRMRGGASSAVESGYDAGQNANTGGTTVGKTKRRELT